MAINININDAFGFAAVCISIILYSSPIPQYFKVCKSKIRFNDAPNLKVLINYFSSINWLIYGYLLKNQHIFFCYLFGAILSILCLITFLLFLAKIKLLKAFMSTFFILVYTVTIYLLLAVLINNNNITGSICVLFSLFSLVNPIQIIKKVVKFRNYKFIPIKLYTLSLIGNTCWIIYGFMIINFYVIIPKLVGLIISLIIMFIWNIFKKRKPIVEDVANFSINNNTRNKTENTVTVV